GAGRKCELPALTGLCLYGTYGRVVRHQPNRSHRPAASSERSQRRSASRRVLRFHRLALRITLAGRPEDISWRQLSVLRRRLCLPETGCESRWATLEKSTLCERLGHSGGFHSQWFARW